MNTSRTACWTFCDCPFSVLPAINIHCENYKWYFWVTEDESNKPELWPINSVALTTSPILLNASIMSLKWMKLRKCKRRNVIDSKTREQKQRLYRPYASSEIRENNDPWCPRIFYFCNHRIKSYEYSISWELTRRPDQDLKRKHTVVIN